MTSIASWIDRHAAFDPEKPALIFEGRAITYAELAERIRGCARMLKHELGVHRGDRVAYLGYNSPEFLVVMFACARLGAIFLPLNWRLAPPEQRAILADAAVKVLVVEVGFRQQVEAIRTQLPNCALLACRFEPIGRAKAWCSMADLTARARGDDSNPRVSPGSPLLLVYTSGTTGRPKGTLLSQQALHYNALNSLHMHGMTSADRVLTGLPLFHVGGLNIQTTPALYTGASVVLQPKFDAAETLACIRADQPTLTVLVPAAMAALIDHEDWQRTELACLRMLTTGSSHVPSSLIEPFHARGIPVVQVYGGTETCPIAVYQRAKDAYETVGSVGKPALHCDLRIVDDAGNAVQPGTAGELLIRGPSLFSEYWGDEEATAKTLRNGWFHTADIGYQDVNGHVWIIDRKSDVVISGGEKIYPAELQQVLDAMPEIAESAVFGRADAQWGEVPVAVVVLKEGATLDGPTVLARFEGRLARFKHPKDILFAAQLPRNAMGKVLRDELRAVASQP